MLQLQSILPPKPFILIRHGQSEANCKGQACGQLDSPLTLEGRRQAQRTACILHSFLSPSRTIIHTGLFRSRETAEIIIGSKDIVLTLVSDLSEHQFGVLEGEPWEKVLALLEQGLQPPGGESRLQFVHRTLLALSHVLNTYSEPIIVAHGGTFFAIAYAYGFLSQDVQNCEVIQFLPKNDEIFPWETYQITNTLPLKLYELTKKKP